MADGTSDGRQPRTVAGDAHVDVAFGHVFGDVRRRQEDECDGQVRARRQVEAVLPRKLEASHLQNLAAKRHNAHMHLPGCVRIHQSRHDRRGRARTLMQCS